VRVGEVGGIGKMQGRPFHRLWRAVMRVRSPLSSEKVKYSTALSADGARLRQRRLRRGEQMDADGGKAVQSSKFKVGGGRQRISADGADGGKRQTRSTPLRLGRVGDLVQGRSGQAADRSKGNKTFRISEFGLRNEWQADRGPGMPVGGNQDDEGRRDRGTKGRR
jgi:hypothetical protein